MKPSSVISSMTIVARAVAALPALLLAGPAPGEATAAIPPQIPVAALFSDPMLDYPRISPDGKDIVAIHSKDGVQYLVIRPTEGGEARPLVRAPDPDFRFSRILWANDQTLLVSAQMRSPHAVGMRARATRLFAIDRSGGRLRYLAEKWPNADYMHVQDHVLRVLPDDPERVLIEYWQPGQYAPVTARMKVSNGNLSDMGPRVADVYSWFADSSGAVRAGAGQNEQTSVTVIYARAARDGELQKIAEFNVTDATYTFAGFSEDPNVVYLLSDYELGRDALYEYNLGEHHIGRRLFAHEWADVDALRYTPGTDHLIAVTFAGDDRQEHWFDEAAEREQREVDAIAPKIGKLIVSQSRDGKRAVLRSSSDTQPPVYWLYDRTNHAVQLLYGAYPKLSGVQLNSMQPVQFQARDDLTIHGYLTLPAGRVPKKLPVIVLLHGGPRARDVRDWDPEVQLFANHGFAVMQINFRGSSGYGRKFMTLGDEQWGLAMQDDVTDGVRWLIDGGIADPDRIGIYGGSYGGYAAMMGLVRTPELFRCGASYAGVMDLPGMLRDDEWYSNGRLIRELVGDPAEDRERLRETSPIENIARIRVPVMLAHGEDDGTVHVHQTQKMAKAMQAAGKDVELMIFPDEIHGFKEERNRIEFYTHLIAFFERNLAPRASSQQGDSRPAETSAPSGSGDQAT
jgi:dipeptidyl aminopeptidase/acylaminoacyl peptidase